VTETRLDPMRSPRSGAGDLLRLFREHPPLTRADLGTLTGLSRATVNQRLDVLLGAKLITAADGQSSRRGRPAERFGFNASNGVLLLADIGATGMRTALCDLSGEVRHERVVLSDVTDGPQTVLSTVHEQFTEMLAADSSTVRPVQGIGLSVPGPVDFDAAQVVNPPIMTGWDRYDIRGWFAAHYPCPVVVEKDANAMAFGEQRMVHRDVRDMLFLKLGTGVGAGIIANGQVYRGSDGAAGDIGHNQIAIPDDAPEPLCRCGNTGCVEAYAGGWALVRDLRAEGYDLSTVDQAVERITAGDQVAVRLARRAGVVGLGYLVADHVFDPSRVERSLVAG
jgi:predicted NBD/HSP70 family sugar kinase